MSALDDLATAIKAAMPGMEVTCSEAADPLPPYLVEVRKGQKVAQVRSSEPNAAAITAELKKETASW